MIDWLEDRADALPVEWRVLLGLVGLLGALAGCYVIAVGLGAGG